MYIFCKKHKRKSRLCNYIRKSSTEGKKPSWLALPLWGLTALQTELNSSCEQADATDAKTGKTVFATVETREFRPKNLKSVGTPIASSFHAMKKGATKCYFIFFLMSAASAEMAILQGGVCVGS